MKRLLPILVGIISCAYIVLTQNFAFSLAPSQGMFFMLLNILLPKIAFSAILGIGFWAIIPHEKLRNSLLIGFCPLIITFAYQLSEIIIKWKSIKDIALMQDTRGTFFPLPIWVFIAILVFLDFLYFEKEGFKRLLGDLLGTCCSACCSACCGACCATCCGAARSWLWQDAFK